MGLCILVGGVEIWLLLVLGSRKLCIDKIFVKIGTVSWSKTRAFSVSTTK